MPDDLNPTGSPSSVGKLISLRGHQAAEQAVDDLLAIGRADPRFLHFVAQVFSLGAPLLSAIVRRLDAGKPDNLLTLGEVLGRYPGRAQAVRSLVRAANDKRAPDARRLGAIVVLGLYDYGVLLPPLHDFVAGLSAPASALAGALVEAAAGYEVASSPQDWQPLFALLLSQPPELLYEVAGALADEQHREELRPAAVRALSLCALHTYPELMNIALEALMSVGNAEGAHALAALQPSLPPEPAHMVARYLRKQRLSGALADREDGASLQSWQAPQAWVSAIDGKGRSLLRLDLDSGKPSRSLEMMLSDTQGIIDGALKVQVSSTKPNPQDRPIPLYGEHQFHRDTLVSIPHDYALEVLQGMVRANWISGTSLPMAYSLECYTIWSGGAGVVAQAEALPDVTGGEASADEEPDLLSHRGFADWYLDTPATHVSAKEIAASSGSLSREVTEENWRILLPSIIRLAHDEFTPELRALYAQRLRAMARWLYFGGHRELSVLAASAAYTMTHSPPEANLFVLRLVQKGILVALSQLLDGGSYS